MLCNGSFVMLRTTDAVKSHNLRQFWENKIVGRGFGLDTTDGVPAALRAGS